MSEYYFRKCTENDLELLREFSYRTFDEAFRHMNSPETMQAYLDEAFEAGKLSKELSNSHSYFYFLYIGGQLAGYIKLNDYPAQTDFHDKDSLEIERIYVAKEYQGKGMGKALMDKAVGIAESMGKVFVWLGVWEKNIKALEFYKRNGFKERGSHSFFMGSEEQTDYIMRKDLSER